MSGHVLSHRRIPSGQPPEVLRKAAQRAAAECFCCGGSEPRVADMLRDPIIALVMRRDQVSADDVLSLIRQATTAL